MSQTTYPCTEAAYWVIRADNEFSVEVIIPWNYPITVSPFATADDAKAWIAEHQRQAQSEGKPSGRFRSSGKPARDACDALVGRP